MSDAINPPPPKQPTTIAMPAVPDWAIELTRSVKEGFTELRADIQLVSTDVSVVKERIRLVEGRMDNLESRADQSSLRVRGESDVNLKQDAALAQVITSQQALTEKVDTIGKSLDENNEATAAIKKAVSGLLKEHPQLVTGFVTLAAAAVAYATAWFQAKGH